MSVVCSILTPTTAVGAVGVVRVWADSESALDRVLLACGLSDRAGSTPRVGAVLLVDLLGVDRGLVARWNVTTVDLFPHAGPLVQRLLLDSLVARGISIADPASLPWHSRQPAAADELEAHMLDALARAASSRAVDALLVACRAWQSRGQHAWRAAPPSPHDSALARLIDPPLVVLAGTANIGKSTLLNALARRDVSIVDSTPGSTRDHVGAILELDGVTARVVDTPGLRSTDDPIEHAAQTLAHEVIRAADVLVLCGDADHEPPSIAPRDGQALLRIALRTDLGEPAWRSDASVCVPREHGIDALARQIRRTLVSDEALAGVDSWVFWR